ncbi:hypothetical protein VCHA52P455_40208 [Vibrio chagasii]|nr:hypothetical protein VCHA52P455_40208 [Vibrio chagasii]
MKIRKMVFVVTRTETNDFTVVINNVDPANYKGDVFHGVPDFKESLNRAL